MSTGQPTAAPQPLLQLFLLKGQCVCVGGRRFQFPVHSLKVQIIH